MRSFIEILVAFFAAGGLLALGWLLFGRLLAPVGEGLYALVPARGDAPRLEHDVAGLLWLRGGGLARLTVVIVDDGLDSAGLAVAAAVLERERGVLFCTREELGGL